MHIVWLQAKQQAERTQQQAEQAEQAAAKAKKEQQAVVKAQQEQQAAAKTQQEQLTQLQQQVKQAPPVGQADAPGPQEPKNGKESSTGLSKTVRLGLYAPFSVGQSASPSPPYPHPHCHLHPHPHHHPHPHPHPHPHQLHGVVQNGLQLLLVGGWFAFLYLQRKKKKDLENKLIAEQKSEESSADELRREVCVCLVHSVSCMHT